MSQRPEVEQRTNRKILGILAAVLLAVLAFLSCILFTRDAFGHGYLLAAGLVNISAFFAGISAIFLCYLNLVHRSALWILGPVVGFSAALIFGFSPYMVPVWIFCLIGSKLLYFMLLKRLSRVPVVTAFSALMGLCILAQLLIHAYELFGSLEVQTILEFVQLRATAFAERLAEAIKVSLASQPNATIAGNFVSLLASSLVVSLPGLFLTVVFFFSYASTWILRMLMKNNGMLQMLYPDGFYSVPSIVTAGLYAVCIVATSLLSNVLPINVASMFSNVSSVLELLFAFVGISMLFRPRTPSAVPMRRQGSFYWLIALLGVSVLLLTNRSATPLMLVYGLVSLLSVAIPVLSFVGLFHSIFAYIRSRKSKPSDQQKGE